jgi:hypothetical protein
MAVSAIHSAPTEGPITRRRGRPPGSKNKTKTFEVVTGKRHYTRKPVAQVSTLAHRVQTLVSDNKTLKATVQDLEAALKQISEVLPAKR